MKFRPGATAPLVSPPACGSYTAQAELTPWSAPGEPRFVGSEPFAIATGVREGACPSGGVPPFKPEVISGTENNDGGSYSPFYLRILRQDGEQELTRFSTTLPPGLTGNLSGIPFCPETDIQHAREQTGAEEETSPACPRPRKSGTRSSPRASAPCSRRHPERSIWRARINGAPLSIVSVTSAKVGPFDLGTVVIRFALNINPTTAQVEVQWRAVRSDPAHHQRHRRPRPRHPRLHEPPGLHRSTPPTATH